MPNYVTCYDNDLRTLSSLTLVPYQNLPVKKNFGCSSCSLKILTFFFYEITPFPTTQHAKLCPLVVCFDPCLLVGMAVRASAVGLDFLVVGLYLWLQLRHQSHLPTARYCGGRLSSTPAHGKLFPVIFLYLGHCPHATGFYITVM